MFKPDPKKQVILKFQELFGRSHKLEARGVRIARIDGRTVNTYMTQLLVDGQQVAEAMHRDWRMSYKMLKIEVEKLYADGKSF